MDTSSATAWQWAAAEAVVAALPAAALLLDAQLSVATLNPAARELLGPQAASGADLQSLLRPADAAVVQDAAAALAAGTRCEWPVRLPGRDGDDRAVRLHVAPLRLTGTLDGEVDAALVTLVPQPDVRAEALAQALRTDEIVLHYQPIVRLADRRPVAVEALARWAHPERGLLRPAEFLELADTAALAGALGLRVLRQACHAAASWGGGAGARDEVRVAVNLSERQLLQPGAATLVREALTVAACPPARLLVEVPERALLREPDAAGAALRALSALGVGVVVDDLGTGSSPLSYLTRFPVDLVKIDRSLVARLGVDREQSAVVASLVSLAQAIGVPCVAEGVETHDQLDVLGKLGCELAQGYLFSRPLDVDAATRWLDRALSARTPVPLQVAAEPGAAAERALQLQAEGASLHTVAARLNAEGLRNAKGRRWHHTSVAQLIASHRYPELSV